MAQTELILRLLKDNKIVGYEYRNPFSTSTKIIYIHHFDKLPIDHSRGYSDHSRGYNTITGGGNVIYYDSFELGIKVGDEWWFEGDIIKDKHGINFIIIFNGLDFLIQSVIQPKFEFKIQNIDEFKCIGTIHDEVKDA
jgi:hypothetical protein